MAQDWQGMSSGDPRISYDDSGRPLFSNDQLVPRNLLHWRDTNVPTAERAPQPTSRWSFRPWGSLSRAWGRQEPSPPAPVAQESAVFVTRRQDYPSLLAGPKYVEYAKEPVVHGSAQHVIYPGKTHMEALVVDEMKVYNDRPFLFWLFIVDGVALIVLGVLSLIWCLSWDIMFYSRFWTGILLILFGMAGAIHRGDYYKRVWKSWLFIILGVVTAAAVMACTCFTLNVFCHQLIEVIQFDSWTDYKKEMLYRITNLPDYPRNNLSTPTFPNDNLIACFVMDGIQVLLLMIAFLTVTSLMLVIDRFYNSHFIITRMVEPFCEPRLFNPFGQVSMGQAQIFIGFVLQASVHGAEEFLWQRTYAPVWAGIIPCVAGVFAALSLKSCGLKHRIWNMLSIILEILAIVGSIVAIVLVTIGMVQHYETLGTTPVMTHTEFAQRLIVASIFLFCLSDITCIVNIFYAIALLVRLIVCICCRKAEDQVPMITYVEDDVEDPVFFPSTAEYQKYRYLDKQALAEVKDLKR